jgi:hypothetical protein
VQTVLLQSAQAIPTRQDCPRVQEGQQFITHFLLKKSTHTGTGNERSLALLPVFIVVMTFSFNFFFYLKPTFLFKKKSSAY